MLGDFVFRVETRDLRDKHGNRVNLRNKPSEVLACLAEQPGEIIGKSEILTYAWPDTTVTDESLTQCIAEIRRTLGDKDQTLVKTFVGKGYCLDVTPQAPEAATRRRRIMAALPLLAVVAGLALWWVWPDAAPAEPPRIAVLAFDDLSAGEDNGYLGDGLAEGVITELARFKTFAVIARNSSFKFRDKDLGVPEIAEQLRADWIVEGSKQKSGDRLRVTVQLLAGRDGTHVWAEDYDADIGELFDVQSEIVRSIARNIGRQVVWRSPPPTNGRATVSAMHLYIQGNAQYRKKTREGTHAARDYYLKAIEADPDAPFGYVGMAHIHWRDYMWNWIDPEMSNSEKLRLGAEAADKALTLDPDYYWAHVARADIHTLAGEPEEAIIRYRTATDLNPSASGILAASAEPLVWMGRAEEAIPILQQAIARDPITPNWYYWNLGWAQWAAGHCAEGLQSMKMMEKIPESALRTLAVLYACNGDADQARATLADFMATNPDHTLAIEFGKWSKSWREPETMERWINDLRVAGMPDA